MNEDQPTAETHIAKLFANAPACSVLFHTLHRYILDTYPDASYKTGRTQVSYYNKHGFAYLWPPLRKIKGRPDVYIVLSFGLDRKIEDSRITEVVEPYPERWTHHVLISRLEDFDLTVKDWLGEAYRFAQNK